jgi:hypothetical protein
MDISMANGAEHLTVLQTNQQAVSMPTTCILSHDNISTFQRIRKRQNKFPINLHVSTNRLQL